MKLRQRKRFAMVSVLLIFLTACVSSPETKMASTQYKSALNAYSQNVRAFEDAWVAEIDLLIRDLGAALAARAVTERVRILSESYDGFTNTDWEQEVARNGLITLSEAIDNERDRVRAVLTRLSDIERPDIDDPAAVVDHVLQEYRDISVEALGNTELLPADERARLLAEAEAGPFGNDDVANALLKLIITWELARDAIPGDIRNLQTVLAALKKAHASVDRWIQTDVTVPGEDVAALVQEWSATVGGAE